MNQRSSFSQTLLLLASLCLSCAGADESAPPAEKLSVPIVNGDTPGALSHRLGAVFLGNCSGTLVTNRHVLTAAHCAPFPATVAFQTPSGTQNLPVASSEVHGGLTSDFDFALLTLSTPAVVDGAPDTLNHRLSTSLTVGTPVSCLGFGCNSRDATNSCTGFGMLRRAELTISGIAGMIETMRNARGQVGNLGDSGSTCHVSVGPEDSVATPIIGALSFVYMDIFDGNASVTAHYTPPWTTRNWVESRTTAAVHVTLDTRAPIIHAGVPTSLRLVTSGHSAEAQGIAGQTLSITQAIPRSGRFDVVPRAATHTCRRLTGIAPMTGDVVLTSTCLGMGMLTAAM